jgi:hypothetical protein
MARELKLEPGFLRLKAGRRRWPGAVGFGGIAGGGREGRQAGPTWQQHDREKTLWVECANQKGKA